MYKFLTLFFLLSVPIIGMSHGHEADEKTLQATMELYRHIIDLDPGTIDNRSASTASIKIAGQTIWLNGPFWELTRQWIRIYYRSLKAECDNCVQVDESAFLREAEDHLSRSFFTLKVGDPAMESLEHITVGAADVGARFGKTAFASKIAAEIAETVLSKMSFMGGLHFFCNFIDVFILFGTRHIQIGTRALTWGRVFDRNSMTQLMQTFYVSRIVKKAQRRVQFTVEPVTVNHEQLKEVDLEGPNRWWGLATQGKRAAWVNKLVKRAQTKLSQREFLGGRMKRYFFLKGRRRGHATFMKGQTEMDKNLNQNLLWILSVEENILERSIIPKGEELTTAHEGLAQAYALPEDEVRQGLVEEFSRVPTTQALVDSLLRDVEVIFNPKIPQRVRYFQAAALESLLIGFVYNTFSQVLAEKSEMYGHSFGGIWNQSRMRWKVGSFGSYIYELTDLWRLAALQNNSDSLMRHKHEAMESLIRIFSYLKKTQALLDAESIGDLQSLESLLNIEHLKLKTFRPWSEKRIARSFLPFQRPRPKCEQMSTAVGP